MKHSKGAIRAATSIVSCIFRGPKGEHEAQLTQSFAEIIDRETAAPELLEALESLLSLCTSEIDGVWEGPGSWEEAKVARAAIKKAGGET